MGNRFFSLLLSMFLLLFVNSVSFTQDKKTGDNKKPAKGALGKTTESRKDKSASSGNIKKLKKEDVKKEEEAQLPKQTAKTYFDGYITFVNSLVLFKLSSQDNVMNDKIFYKIDKGEFVAYSEPFSVKEEGNHTISYYSIDKMGNKENNLKVLNFITDNTAPTVLLTVNMPTINEKLYASEKLAFTINAKDDLSGVSRIEYSTDGKNYITYSNPFNVVSEGETNIKIRVTDNVDNSSEKFTFRTFDEEGKTKESTVASVKVYIDKTPPVVSINADKNFIEKDGKKIASTSFKYTVSATDSDSGVSQILVRVDGKGDFQPYKKEIEFTDNGSHQIEAIARDKVGNVSDPVTLSVFVDVLPPVSEIKLLTEK